MKDYTYDYKNRLIQYRYYVSSGVVRDRTTYTNDPLDRPVRTIEEVNLDSAPVTTTTDLVYIGLSDAIGKETLTGGVATTKTYAYDALGRRATLASGSTRYSYLNDPYGSVSLLVDQNRVVKESYGYTGYGNANSSLTKSTSGFNPTNGPPTNAYRFSAKRFDKATASYDMGARRYSASSGRFIQRDAYDDALDNLDLASDPLTGNRYALAAGNPVNFVEIDGHGLGGWLKKRYEDAKSAGRKVVQGAKKVGGYCLGRGAAVCATVAAGTALVATGVGSGPGAAMIAAGATAASRGLTIYAATRSSASAAKRGDYVGAATSIVMARGGGAASAVRREVGAAARSSTRTYQTYTKTQPVTGQVYSGRTSGYGTARQNVARRDASHTALNKQGFGPTVLDKSSRSAAAIRGREQQLIERNGGARSVGGTSANKNQRC